MADYSKDTNDRRKAFLALRPQLRQLGMKYDLFDPARMWVTKNGVSKVFYNPEDLRLFLDSFQHQPMDSTTSTRPQDISEDHGYTPSQVRREEEWNGTTPTTALETGTCRG
ncbi:hypothetical protein NDU88_010162 [Pleurodeles waltl]|uniref:Uncharacterized protein n=1 Tax=Pleurodeles waltl TaxID=8319 RepID=A0AAV7QXF2_PLEWA|nr:hypothetical protein NDU88_010162 [Pleurodeles waltl]